MQKKERESLKDKVHERICQGQPPNKCDLASKYFLRSTYDAY